MEYQSIRDQFEANNLGDYEMIYPLPDYDDTDELSYEKLI